VGSGHILNRERNDCIPVGAQTQGESSAKVEENPLKLLIVALSLALLLPGSVSAQTYYKWRDAAGTVHFTSEPPVNRDYEVINISGHVIGQSMAEPANATEAAAQQPPVQMPREAGIDPNLIAQRCQQARENLYWLRANRRIVVERDDGSEEFIDAEEQQRQIAQNQAFIDEWCRDPG